MSPPAQDALSGPRRGLLRRVWLWLPALALGLYLGAAWRTSDTSSANATPNPATPNPATRSPAAPSPGQARAAQSSALLESEQATIRLFKNAAPSVVFITTLTQRQIGFSRYRTETPSGTGSGFVWDNGGHIVTNFHVIQRASRALVTLEDQSSWEAKVVGWAEEKDLAVLKIEAPRNQLPAIPVGRSRDLQVGQSVYAIGNPFGLDHTLTTGVISAVDREIESLNRRPIRDVIQTDAAINPGNSGGPLLDSSGRLIGVNTQIYSPSGASAGIGFAIPVDTVNWVVPDLIQYGEIRRPMLGINGQNVSYPKPDSGGKGRGVLILTVGRGTGAARAGLRAHQEVGRGQVGDVILAVNDEPIATMDDLVLTLEKYDEQDEVTVTLLRGERQIEVPVELGIYSSRRRRQ